MNQTKRIMSYLVVGFMICLMIPINLSGTAAISEIETAPEGSGILDIIWTPDGDWWPDNSIARYRGAEYPADEVFYQWWYWMVKDLQSDNYFAVCYYTIRAPENPDIQGLYMLFSAVMNAGKIMIWYKMPYDQLVFRGNDFDLSLGTDLKFNQVPISDNLYHVDGIMDNPARIWTSQITYPGVDTNTQISWSWNIARIVGCCTQNDFIDGILGGDGIKWDTFCMDALVTGSVQIGNQLFSFDGSSRYRAYGDTNFDKIFLGKPDESEPEDKYRWSWASVTKYNNVNPSNDISIIAGYGLSDNMYGISINPLAIFAAAYNVLGHNIVWKSIDTREGLIDVNLVEECSWGSVCDDEVEISVEAWNYFTYTDIYGSALIPAYQKYIMEGEYVKIEMTIYVTPSDINRLPSAYTEYYWSNFEALGATALVKIYSKTYKWYDPLHLFPQVALVDQFYDYDAGLEYGYAADIVL